MENCKCKNCETTIGENDYVAFTLDGNTICEDCEQYAWEYSNTVVVAEEGELTTYRWCAELGFRETECWEEQSPSSVTGFTYHKSDGWRGHWDADVAQGYTSYASGWSTGRWSDVGHKHSFNDLCDAIQSGDVYPPVPVTFALGLTSNVFSMSTDIILKDGDADLFNTWVEEELGITPENLQRALR